MGTAMQKEVSVGDVVTVETLHGEVAALVTSVFDNNGTTIISAIWTSHDPTNNDPYGRALVRATGLRHWKVGLPNA